MNHFYKSERPWLMLVIRSLLFLTFQALIGLFLLVEIPTYVLYT